MSKYLPTKISEVEVVDEATARQWYAETRLNFEELDVDEASKLCSKARKIMIDYLPPGSYWDWYGTCEAYTRGHADGEEVWTNDDLAEGITKVFLDINNKYVDGDISDEEVGQIVRRILGEFPDASKKITDKQWEAIGSRYWTFGKKDFSSFSGDDLRDFIECIFNKICEKQDVDESGFNFPFDYIKEKFEARNCINEIISMLYVIQPQLEDVSVM